VIEFGTHRAETRLDVPQALAKCELRETQAQKLIATGKTAQATMPSVALDAGLKLATREKIHQLREHEMPVEHKTTSAVLARKTCPCQGSNVIAISDRVQTFVDGTNWSN
jgi:hypothetical protein